MKTAELIQKIEAQFRNEIEEVDIKSIRRVSVCISKDALSPVAQFLLLDLGFRFIIASAYQGKNGFEILYHFSFDTIGLILNLHVTLPEEAPEIESLCSLLDGANWIEREMHELFGIDFINHPNLEKLISEGNWASGTFPYARKK